MEDTKIEGVLSEEEKNDIISKAYNIKEGSELTEEEEKIALKMFENPQSFIVLRKMLNVFSHMEKGITLKNGAIGIDMYPEDLEAYGKKVAIEALADEKIRMALYSFYTSVQSIMMRAKREEINKAEIEAVEEADAREEFEQEQEDTNRVLGDHL